MRNDIIQEENHEIESNFRNKKYLIVIVTKLETILETKKNLVSKLVSIIVKWFLNWYLISN